MGAIVTSLLALLTQIAGTTAEAGAIAKIVATLIDIIPVVIQTARDVVPAIKNIIAALSANPATTEEQLKQLQALDAQVDQAFEAAATTAEAEDKAAGSQ